MNIWGSNGLDIKPVRQDSWTMDAALTLHLTQKWNTLIAYKIMLHRQKYEMVNAIVWTFILQYDPIIAHSPCPIESTKTTSMEDVSTGVLEKIKNISEVKTKPKMIWCIKTYIIAYVKIQKKWRYTIQYVKPTAQLVFKIRFPKDGPTCRRQVVNPRHQTSQGQSVAKPETPLQNIQVE